MIFIYLHILYSYSIYYYLYATSNIVSKKSFQFSIQRKIILNSFFLWYLLTSYLCLWRMYADWESLRKRNPFGNFSTATFLSLFWRRQLCFARNLMSVAVFIESNVSENFHRKAKMDNLKRGPQKFFVNNSGGFNSSCYFRLSVTK